MTSCLLLGAAPPIGRDCDLFTANALGLGTSPTRARPRDEADLTVIAMFAQTWQPAVGYGVPVRRKRDDGAAVGQRGSLFIICYI